MKGPISNLKIDMRYAGIRYPFIQEDTSSFNTFRDDFSNEVHLHPYYITLKDPLKRPPKRKNLDEYKDKVKTICNRFFQDYIVIDDKEDPPISLLKHHVTQFQCELKHAINYGISWFETKDFVKKKKVLRYFTNACAEILDDFEKFEKEMKKMK